MKSIWTITFSLIVLALTSGFAVFKLYCTNKQLETTLLQQNSEIQNQKASISSSKEIILWNSTSNGDILHGSTKLIDEKGTEVLLKEISTDFPLIILRINELNCLSCLNKQAQIFQEIVGKKNNLNKPLIFATYTNIDDMYKFKRANQIDIPVFNVKKFDLRIEATNEPYLFILTRDMVVNNVFLTSKLYPNLTRDYLNRVIEK